MNKLDPPCNILDYFNAPPSPLNQADIFDIFLQILKTPTDSPLGRLTETLAFPNSRPQFPFESSIPTAIKIMESDIFYEGGLKSNTTLSHYPTTIYESYPIKDLPVFVFSLAMFLDLSSKARDAELREEQVKKGFARVLSGLSVLVPLVRRVKGERRAGQLEKARQALVGLEKETLATRTIIKLKPYQIKKVVAYLFESHIKGPKDIMAYHAAELLTSFSIQSTPEGMRELFKGK